MSLVGRKVFLMLLLTMSASCRHIVDVQNDGIAFNEPESDDDILFIRDEISGIVSDNDDDNETSPVVEFYDENKDMKESKENEATKINLNLKFKSQVDDIADFNSAFERELKRKELLLKRYQDQSRRIAKIQHEVRLQEENTIKKKYQKPSNLYDDNEDDFWSIICKAGRSIVEGFLKFFGFKC